MWSRMGQKKLGRIIYKQYKFQIDRLAQISSLEGRNDKYTVHRIRISWTTVCINKQPQWRYSHLVIEKLLQMLLYLTVNKTL